MQGQPSAGPAVRFLRPAGRFGLQFMEMCFVMCAGGVILNLAVFQGAAVIGYSDLVQRAPAAAMLVIGVDWALAMGAWMAFRGHPWRHNLEMSSTAVIVAILFSIATAAGIIRVATPLGWFSLFTLMCAPACLVMGADMLYRFNHYSGQAAHHEHSA